MAVEDAVPIEGETLHRSSSGSPGMKKRNKLDIFNAVIQHLSDNKKIEISSDMEDSLWAHFKSLPTKYAMDVNVERPEDVLMHMKLLEEARDPAKCPSFSACVVQVHRTIDENTVENEAASNFLRTQKAPPPFGSSPNLEALDINNIEDTVKHSARAMHQITFSSDDKPKVLNQLTSILGELGLNIQEAHAFSTTDGLSLDIFVVIGWHYEEIEELKQALEKKIRRIKGPEMEEEELVQKSGNGHVEIRKDEKSDWEIDFNLLSVRNKIASGSYGDLYRGVYCSQDVAIKVIKAEQVNEDVQREFAHEVYIMRKIRHKNVVQFIGACTVPPRLCIVTEFMSGGSIYDYLHKENGFFKLPTLLRMAIDVSKGMSYLHENNIIHRDLKTANLLMDENKVVKVADFGVARVKAKSGVMTAETGTYRWMAPEVIEHKPYDHKADVFSFGIVLWEFLTGKVPYDDMQPLQAAIGVVRKGLRPTIPEETNPKLVELLNRCWQQDPTLRPDFSQILETLKCIAKEVGDDSHDHKTKSPRGFFPFRRNRNE